MYRRYQSGDFTRVRALTSAGLSDYAVARELGMPRTTVQAWRRRKLAPATGLSRPLRWRPAEDSSYAYLLGAYLGDGHIVSTSANSSRLNICLDARYPAVVEEIAGAIAVAFPGTTVRRNAKPGAVLLCASRVDWPRTFPQHGPGKKHARSIALVDWQREITREYPRSLLRGLIHSDGCRCIHRFQTKLPSGRTATYAYPRYFFTNYSAGIRAIFCDHCDLLGIGWTQSSARNISISHRESVARMDSFIGPKG